VLNVRSGFSGGRLAALFISFQLWKQTPKPCASHRGFAKRWRVESDHRNGIP